MNQRDHVKYDHSYQAPPELGSQSHNAWGDDYSDSSDEGSVRDNTMARDKKRKKVDT